METQKVFLKEKSKKHIMCFFQVSQNRIFQQRSVALHGRRTTRDPGASPLLQLRTIQTLQS